MANFESEVTTAPEVPQVEPRGINPETGEGYRSGASGSVVADLGRELFRLYSENTLTLIEYSTTGWEAVADEALAAAWEAHVLAAPMTTMERVSALLDIL